MNIESDDSNFEQAIEGYFHSVRKTITLGENDYICTSEDAALKLDNKRLDQYERMILQIIIAGSSTGLNPRLYEKMKHEVELIAQSVRIINGAQTLNVRSWANLVMPEFTILDPHLLKGVQEAKELISNGQPITVETLFAMDRSRQTALQISQEILGQGAVFKTATGRCERKGIAISFGPDSTFTSLTDRGKQLVYGTYAKVIENNSILSGPQGLLQKRYFVAGMISEINTMAKK